SASSSPAAPPTKKPATTPSQPSGGGTVTSSGTCGVSYYGDGQTTASGEPFDPTKFTAAHKTLPFNTRVRVTNPKNGKSVVVPIKLRLPGERRPLSPEARAGLGAAFVLLALISAIDLADGANPNYIGLLASAPFLVATFAAWREVLVVGGLATAIGVAFGSY